MVKEFFRHFWKAKDEHSLHSPFLFEFYNDIIKQKSLPFESGDIIALAKDLSRDQRELLINDLGAGSKFSNKKTKKVSGIAKSSVKGFKWSKIIARIIHKYEFATVLELGTSLGLTTAMMGRATPHGKIYTFEGCSNTLSVAKENLSKLSVNNATAILGDLDSTLENTVKQLPRLDLVFFDANHQYAPTLRYFKLCLSKAHENSCFVFDDIYWSEGMTKAWEEIKEHPEVTISLDFFQIGIVFFRKKQPKQNFTLKA